MDTCLKYFFVVFNVLFAVIGAISVAFAFWVRYVPVIQEVVDKVAYTDLLFYGGLILGGVLLFVGLCGMFGACYKNKCLLGTYIAIMVIFIGAEIALIIYTAVVGANQFVASLEVVWVELTNATKFATQSRFDCCGYQNLSEWNGIYDESCLANSTEPWDVGCSQALLNYFRDNAIVMAIVLGVVLLIELFQIIVTGILIRDAVNVERSERSDFTRRKKVPSDDVTIERERNQNTNQAYDAESYFDDT
ncbi:unnamed protein product [Clavelina lepadiformis]|uniref:Tetraspanin n=2 Tax=Clavelina lepadiformis TaxID=159417 RepID=A0ABP0GH80_CLALP